MGYLVFKGERRKVRNGLAKARMLPIHFPLSFWKPSC